MNKVKKLVSASTFAFQPVVNLNTGIVYGYEALLRNFENRGYKEVFDIFDHAHKKEILPKLDLALFSKSIKFFKKINSYENARLFYNLDNRVLESPAYSFKKIDKIVAESGLNKENICFELSKFYEIEPFSQATDILNEFKENGYSIAVNDFGSGFSNMEKLFFLEPDIIKIDKLFLRDINENIKKQFFTSHIVNFVHTLGGIIIAHGIESKEEILTCRKIGCDLVQGFYIERPIKNTENLKLEYSDKIHLDDENGIFINEDRTLLESKLNNGVVIYNNTSIDSLLRILENNKEVPVIVVLDSNDKPIGIIKEKTIKNYLYRLYGREILAKKTVKELVSPYIVCDINFEISKIVDILNMNRDIKQVLIVDKGRYIGYLDFISIISIISEKKLINASNQNPLTKLPGNNLIHDYIKEALMNTMEDYILIYFDFDNFKAFNDKYGFKMGDKAILMFADLIRSKRFKSNTFEGHIGGDDFFIGIKCHKNELYHDIYKKVEVLISAFNEEAKKYYSKEDIDRGYIEAKDRDGNIRCFPLLKVSASILEIKKENKAGHSIEDISDMIFKIKKTSKLVSVDIAAASVCKYQGLLIQRENS